MADFDIEEAAFSVAGNNDIKEVALASIALSLKRIADALHTDWYVDKFDNYKSTNITEIISLLDKSKEPG